MVEPSPNHLQAEQEAQQLLKEALAVRKSIAAMKPQYPGAGGLYANVEPISAASTPLKDGSFSFNASMRTDQSVDVLLGSPGAMMPGGAGAACLLPVQCLT